jgi:hypothetical protein
LGAALLAAGYELIAGWAAFGESALFVVTIVLWLFALSTCIATLVLSGQDRRRILAAGGPTLNVLGLAARGVRWSSLIAIGVSVLLFANCANSSTGNSLGTVSGVTADPSGFWPLAAWVMLPLLLALAMPAGLATAAQLLARNGRRDTATRAVVLGMWSAGLIAMVAFATTTIALFAGISYCDFGVNTQSRGACAAGLGGLMNPTAIGSLLLIVPYLVMMNNALRGRVRAAGSPERTETDTARSN